MMSQKKKKNWVLCHVFLEDEELDNYKQVLADRDVKESELFKDALIYYIEDYLMSKDIKKKIKS